MGFRVTEPLQMNMVLHTVISTADCIRFALPFSHPTVVQVPTVKQPGLKGANPQPGLCENLIRLTTEIILNGETCNGSATARPGQQVRRCRCMERPTCGQPVKPDRRSTICAQAMNYSVIVVDSSGCAVSGSFSFGGNIFIPDTLIGFWNFEQYDKSFIFNIPVFSDSIRCVWDFGDGDTASGNSVTHTYDAESNYNVALRIFDT